MLEYVIGLLKDYYIHGNSNYEQNQVNTGKKSLDTIRELKNISQLPSHRLDKVTVPVALLWSDNDWLADPRDAVELI